MTDPKIERDAIMSETIQRLYTEHLVQQLSTNFFGQNRPPLSDAERAWYRRKHENERTVQLGYPDSVEDSIAALQSAAAGLQFPTVEWGSELDSPAVTGFIAGTLCEHPDKKCPLLLGHPGDHVSEWERGGHFPG